MKVKFNKFERVAGIFVGGSILAAVLIGIGVAVKKGWFESKISYQTYLDSAEGLHSGTLVQIAGLRAGSVRKVELISAQKVHVELEVMQKFKEKIRSDSRVQVVRPFVIGEKVLEVSVGEKGEVLTANAEIPSEKSFDMMEILSGKKLGSVFETVNKLGNSVQLLAEAFADEEKAKALVNMFDVIARDIGPLLKDTRPLIKNLNTITRTAVKKDRIEIILSNLTMLSESLGEIVPPLKEEMPDLGTQVGQLVRNLNVLTEEFQKLTPAITTIAPELPRVSLRAVEALDETVVLLKAMQKSFFLRGNVEDVREEELRQPASEKAK